MKFRWRRFISWRALILACFLTGIGLLLGHHSNKVPAAYEFQGKRALRYSPFYRLANSLSLGKTLSSVLHGTSEFHTIGKDWSEMHMENQCRYYFEATMEVKTDWTNAFVKDFYNDENLDDPLAEMMLERIRMYNSCFLKAGLSTSKVFKGSTVKAEELDRRLFPFLTKKTLLGEMWPEIVDANNWTVTPKFCNPLLEGQDTWKMDSDFSFFYNWQQYASEKGIALSLGERHIDQFKRLLQTLDKVNNSLPIQVIHSGLELPQESLHEVHLFLNSYNSTQRVFFINIAPLIDMDFVADYVTFFINKWMASLFNTFSELILLDADVVSFSNLESYFDMQEYKNTGMLLFRDRNINEEKTYSYCTALMKKLFPSVEETYFMGHRSTFPLSLLKTSDTPPESLSLEESIYYKFFDKLQLHHIDSGLVVIDRMKKLPSLLLSLMLNIDGKIQRCVYGDKEIFWLGQLLSGENYTVYPVEGAIVGSLQELPDEASEICATQLGHLNKKGELLWTNGGLKICKLKDAAVTDFDFDPEYFQHKYRNPIALQQIYDQAVSINGYIIPDPVKYPWTKQTECHQYMYCATVKKDLGKAVRFDEPSVAFYEEISNLWNSHVEVSEP